MKLNWIVLPIMAVALLAVLVGLMASVDAVKYNYVLQEVLLWPAVLLAAFVSWLAGVSHSAEAATLAAVALATLAVYWIVLAWLGACMDQTYQLRKAVRKNMRQTAALAGSGVKLMSTTDVSEDDLTKTLRAIGATLKDIDRAHHSKWHFCLIASDDCKRAHELPDELYAARAIARVTHEEEAAKPGQARGIKRMIPRSVKERWDGWDVVNRVLKQYAREHGKPRARELIERIKTQARAIDSCPSGAGMGAR